MREGVNGRLVAAGTAIPPAVDVGLTGKIRPVEGPGIDAPMFGPRVTAVGHEAATATLAERYQREPLLSKPALTPPVRSRQFPGHRPVLNGDVVPARKPRTLLRDVHGSVSCASSNDLIQRKIRTLSSKSEGPVGVSHKRRGNPVHGFAAAARI
jgi:hypothetical protein